MAQRHAEEHNSSTFIPCVCVSTRGQCSYISFLNVSFILSVFQKRVVFVNAGNIRHTTEIPFPS